MKPNLRVSMSLRQPGKLLPEGTHELDMDGKDMASGVYFFQLIVTDESSNILYNKTNKMILLK